MRRGITSGVRSGMSDSEGEPVAAAGGGLDSPSAGGPTDIPVEYSRVTRASLRPPPRYTVSSDLDLWLKRFELYVRQAGVPEDQWTGELLPLLDDEAFRVVLQLGLADSTDFETVTEHLKQQFSPKGNELEWQRRLQTRKQQPGEELLQFAGALRVLADKAYPNWTAAQRGEVLRNHFIQGVSSPSVQLRLMREMPATLQEALSLAVQLHSVETAQQRLYREVQQGEASTMALQQDKIEAECKQSSAAASNTVSREASHGASDLKLDEMAAEIRRLSSELMKLRNNSTHRGPRRPPNQGGSQPTCWNCGERGHIRRNCRRPRKEGRPDGRRGYRSITATNNSALIVEGQVEGRLTKMLIDSGSAVTILREDVWREAGGPSSLDIPGTPVVAANGETLDLLGQTTISIQVAGVKVDYSCLVTKELTQECIIGADFLLDHKCVINLKDHTLVAGGKTIHFLRKENNSPPKVCHVFFSESTVLPGNSEVQLPLTLSNPIGQGLALFEPRQKFMEKHGVLVAHSLSLTGSQKTLVRLLNPSPAPIMIHQNERVGELQPMEQPDSLCTIEQSQPREHQVNQAIDHLLAGVEGVQSMDREKLKALLHEFPDVISVGDHDLGRTSLIQHRINTGNAAPTRQPPRRLPYRQREMMEQHLTKMLNNGVIEPSNGPWSSPVVLVRKKDGSTRFCVDFRKVNDLTKKDAHPLPRIDDTLDALGGAKWFSTLDLASGYWQVEVAPADREKTAFATPDGLYQFCVMPFGLCNAPGTFQRLMEHVLRGLHWSTCLIYLDDVLIFSKTPEEHLERLTEVFARLRNAGLKVKPSKCQLFRKSVQYLGHVVSDRGVETDPIKIKCIQEWPTPANVRELKQFLGLASYYRKFVKSFAKLASPLHRLTEKSKTWAWTSECEQSFNSLKHHLVSAPVLRLPDFTQDFILDVEASGNGLGAVLSQVSEGREQVVAYASRSLSKAERKYCATRRELLALVHGIRHFRPYLYGRTFIARTDHNSLKWLHNFHNPEGQVARWLEILAEYNFKVMHRPGTRHNNADALSRLSYSQCESEVSHKIEAKPATMNKANEEGTVATISQGHSWIPGLETDELKSAQKTHSALLQVITWLSTNTLPQTLPKGSDRCLQSLWTQRRHLLLKDGILYRCWEDVPGKGCNKQLQLVLAPHQVTEVLSKLHNSAGHLGVKKTLEKVRSRFYWVGQRKDVENWCKTCETCASRKCDPKKYKAPMQLVSTKRPLERIAMDILGALPETAEGNKYILVIGDYFTKWKEAYPMKNMEAQTIARILVQEFICRFGVPEFIHTDQGRNFEAEVIKEVCSLLDIKKTRTSPYHPQSDGLVERFNRTLLHMLSTAIEKDHRTWDEQLPLLMLAYRTSVQETTRTTPFLLMFGRSARLPVDIEFNLPVENYSSLSQYQKQLHQQLQQSYKAVQHHASVAQARQKEFYDRDIHGTQYGIGEQVWLHSPAIPRGQCRKFHRPWKGPFTVIKVIGSTLYRIKDNNSPRRRLVVHYNRLKPYSCSMDTNRHSQTPINDSGEDPGGYPRGEPPAPGSEDPNMTAEQSDDNPDIDLNRSEVRPNSPIETRPELARPEPTIPLRRSSRRRQPPDRYGSVISYPDCYSSDSDS